MSQSSTPDVVVVGAGHNGLVTACYLARAGRAVTVLEANDQIGGMTQSLPLVADAPGHLLSPCAIDAVYWRASPVEAELDLPGHGLRMIDHDPAWAWLGPDGESLVLQQDVRATIQGIRRHSRQDADTYRELVDVSLRALDVQDRYGLGSATRPDLRAIGAMLRGVASRPVRRLLGTILTSSAAEVIESTFASRQVRGVFACMASILGSITVDSSAVGVLATAPLHRYGVARPVGGMQAIPRALRRCLESHGGTVRTGARVIALTSSGDRITGVRIADGTHLRTDLVVMATPPHVTGRLLEGIDDEGASALQHAPANAAGIGCLTVGVALGGRVTLPEHQPGRDDVDLRTPTLFHGTLEQVVAAEGQARAGQVPTAPAWTATVLSATDPTAAPDGQDSVYLYAPTPVEPEGGWLARRDDAVKQLVAAVGTTLAGIEDLEIGRCVETPRDLAERTGAARGCIYHVDQVASRLGPLRPARGWGAHATRVDGLVLTGAGTHPGGGVSGIPGRNAARAVLGSHAMSRPGGPRVRRPGWQS